VSNQRTACAAMMLLVDMNLSAGKFRAEQQSRDQRWSDFVVGVGEVDKERLRSPQVEPDLRLG
jgi:hypothetical protein